MPDAPAEVLPDVPSESTPDTTDAPDEVADAGPLCPPRYYQNVATGNCLRAHDLNGDGKADALIVREDRIDALISDGSKFTLMLWFGADLSQAKRVAADDTTGDGFADAIEFRSDSIGAYPSTGDSFATVQDFSVWLEPSLMGTYATQLADVDGDSDHKADVIAVGAGNIRVAVSTGSSFQSSNVWLAQDMSIYEGVYFADVDGDGKADAIAVGKASLDVYRSTGRRFGVRETWYSSRFADSDGPFFADVDGDGRADAVRVEQDAIWVALSDRTHHPGRFLSEERWYTGPMTVPNHRFLVDADGDGRADLVTIDDSSVTVALSTGAAFSAPTVWFMGQLGGEHGVTFAPAPAGATGSGFSTDFVPMPGVVATDIAAGGDESVWAIGTEPVTGGYKIRKWNSAGWDYDSNGSFGAVRIAVDGTGGPWAIKDDGTIFRKISSDPSCRVGPFCGEWHLMDGERASEIGAGGDGNVWIAGLASNTVASRFYYWNGTGWGIDSVGTATRIAVTPIGGPWAISSSGDLLVRGGVPWGDAWPSVPLAGVADIAIGSQGDIFCLAGGPGSIGLFYLDDQPPPLGADASATDTYQLNRIAGAGAVDIGPSSRIAVGAQGEVYVVDRNGDVYTSQR
jgi:hypothetical protein